ncbi:MAG: glycosyltransferase [Pyrinomonadaceae bacterium]|nr:glycosyltransferase [Pyrinomonadaceae bacterium]
MISAFVWLASAVYVLGGIWLWFGLRRPAPAANETAPFVSVIVAARNEAHRIPPLLDDLAAQTYPAYEVLIVDDRSTDATAEIVRTAAGVDAGRLRLINQRDVPVGMSPKKLALQKGIEASRGELLLLTDADCRVRPGWISETVRYFEPDVAMVLGYSELTVDHGSSLFERVQAFEFLTLVAMMAASANLTYPLGASGQNIAFRRSAFERVGGYTSVMHRIAGDDMLMLQLIKRTTEVGRIVYADHTGARNRTYPEKTWRAFRNQRARWASSGTHHFRSDTLFMTYALASLVANMTVLFGAAWAWAGWISRLTWVMTVALKLGVDLLLYTSACRRFNQLGLLRYLPLWFLSQPLYMLAMAVWGQQRHRWTWKP